MTVDPRAITQFSRTIPELEEFLLFAIVVAGKRSDLQSRKLEAFLRAGPRVSSPFKSIRILNQRGQLGEAIEAQRLGQYRRIGAAFASAAMSGLDLRSCSVTDLEAIPGIGPKTARFFLLHSRPGVRVAALDTHILSWMRSQGIQTPAVTPQGGIGLRQARAAVPRPRRPRRGHGGRLRPRHLEGATDGGQCREIGAPRTANRQVGEGRERTSTVPPSEPHFHAAGSPTRPALPVVWTKPMCQPIVSPQLIAQLTVPRYVPVGCRIAIESPGRTSTSGCAATRLRCSRRILSQQTSHCP
jgi:hypothetical protein